MKKIVLIFVVAHLVLINCYGQNLLEPNKKWINSYGTLGTGGPPPYWVHSNICRIDTTPVVINNKAYKKLMYTTDSLGNQWTDYGYLRETPLGKVFYVPSLIDTVEKLVYDFSATTGENLTIYSIYLGTYFTATVTAVDSVFFAGMLRKRIIFNDEWISGIGSTQGLIYNGFFVVGVFYWLNCYFENNILLYHNPTYPNCFFEYTAVNSITSDKNSSIQIVPNPVTGTSTILTSNDLRNNTSCKFELYNLLGTCVKRFSFSTNSTLSKNDIAPGMYYYIVRVQDRIINTGKVIVE